LRSINRPENWSICSYLLTIILQSKMVQISFKIDQCDQQQKKWLTFWIWQRFKAFWLNDATNLAINQGKVEYRYLIQYNLYRATPFETQTFWLLHRGVPALHK
jgi:hypothetical protein